jgi:hypothetical protein
VRADSGSYAAELLRCWEQLRIKFIVVARLRRPVQSLRRREDRWEKAEIEGTEVTELAYQDADAPSTARCLAIRHRVKDNRSRSYCVDTARGKLVDALRLLRASRRAGAD